MNGRPRAYRLYSGLSQSKFHTLDKTPSDDTENSHSASETIIQQARNDRSTVQKHKHTNREKISRNRTRPCSVNH